YPVVPGVGQGRRVEQELRRSPVLALRHRTGEVQVRLEAAALVGSGELEAVDLAPRVVERGEDERLAEEAVVELVPGPLVIAVQAGLEARRKLLADPGVEVVRALGPDRIVLRRGGLVRGGAELRHGGAGDVLDRRRREVAGVARVERGRVRRPVDGVDAGAELALVVE